MPTVSDLSQFLNDFAPLTLAGDWDNVGLLLGDGGAEVRRIMTCLTITPESATEAVDEHADLIVTHHPILFRAVKCLTTADTEGRTLLALARAGIAVYSPHTAFDNTRGGINDMLAERLGLGNVRALRPGAGHGNCKIVVFVPDKDLAAVSDALFRARAGWIGQYRECSFRLAGTGTFFGSDATNPTVGTRGRREEVSEWRLEVICPEGQVEQAVRAMRQAHSYEEPAFDVYPLRPASAGVGEGRIGELLGENTLEGLARAAKNALDARLVQIVGDPDKRLRHVAIVCGSGGDFRADAVAAGADVLVTGEARFHDYLAAQARGLALVLCGHYASERFGVEELARHLARQWPELGVWASSRECEPVRSL